MVLKGENSNKDQNNNKANSNQGKQISHKFFLFGSKKIYVTLAVFVCASAAIIVLFIYPFLSKIIADSNEILQQKQERLTIGADISNLENLKVFYRDHSADFDKIDKLFIDKDVPVEFINFLEKTASDSSISIKISSAASVTKNDPWPSLSFEITLVGPFPKVMRFIEKLESSPYLTDIQNFSVAGLKDADFRLTDIQGHSPEEVRATFLLKAFAR
jgi:hypothetical protein